jgi:hypothetical protein
MSTTTDIADGIVSLLTTAPTGTFGQAFGAARTWLPEQQLEKLEGVVVRVIPRTNQESLVARSAVQNDLGVDVVVMAKLASVDNETIDPMVGLVEQIKGYLRFRQPVTNVAWFSASTSTICATDSLREFSQFTGLFSLTYRWMEGRT